MNTKRHASSRRNCANVVIFSCQNKIMMMYLLQSGVRSSWEGVVGGETEGKGRGWSLENLNYTSEGDLSGYGLKFIRPLNFSITSRCSRKELSLIDQIEMWKPAEIELEKTELRLFLLLLCLRVYTEGYFDSNKHSKWEHSPSQTFSYERGGCFHEASFAFI